ncbi:MAG: ABC transporter substrate-binding protein, partial [Anaerolineales bacterium]|nr:ABC transporter substrate-binding protein [Anaerolineales bacterium]
MKRFHNITTVLLTILLTLVACQATQQDPDPQQPATPLNLVACTSSTSANQIVFVYAQEQGLFEQYGLQVELVTFNNGSDAATALITGAVDICQVAGPSVVNAAAAGEDLVFIAG